MTKTRLSLAQGTLMAAAQWARLDPKPSIGWTEIRVLTDGTPRTQRSLEKLGLIESYLEDRNNKTLIRYRLTQAGIDFPTMESTE
jgi:hypothetical protein